MATHTLKNDMFNLVINERGGCIDCFQYRGKKPFDILRPRTALGNDSAGESGMFPMAPLVNRVRANRFNWRGKQVVLPINPQVDKDFFYMAMVGYPNGNCLKKTRQMDGLS
ncbi:hypothetical protein QYZ44_18160 [Vibrio parahaemolyticus]|nr:hypothetical protein [Vibrio parahaemolyticus]